MTATLSLNNMDFSFLLIEDSQKLFQKVISKWGQFRQLFISKWGKHYFKVGQRQLFESGSMFISYWGNYSKVGITTYTFLAFLILFFIKKKMCCYYFHNSFFDAVPNFCKRILTNQKPE